MVTLQHPTVDEVIQPDKKEILDKIDLEITKAWQSCFDKSLIAKHNQMIQNIVNFNIKITYQKRRKDVFLTRLRLGVCKLNHYLKIQGNHKTGLCTTCRVPETIAHYILSCSASKIGDKVKRICTEEKIECTLKSVLNNKKTLDTIYESINVNI